VRCGCSSLNHRHRQSLCDGQQPDATDRDCAARRALPSCLLQLLPRIKEIGGDTNQLVRSALATVVMELAPILGKVRLAGQRRQPSTGPAKQACPSARLLLRGVLPPGCSGALHCLLW
jgi:hypothetical protein